LRNGLRFLILAAAVLAGPAEAHAQLGDPVRVPFAAADDAFVSAASSGPGTVRR
jgi:hypothetical protein